VLLGNADVVIGHAYATEPSPLYRNAIGDELVYVQSGRGVLESVFGPMAVGTGDYVVIPTSPRTGGCPSGAQLRLAHDRGQRPRAAAEAYLTPFGQFTEFAPLLRTRPPRAARAAVRRGHRRRRAGAQPRRADPVHVCVTSVRRDRLGRLPVSVHVQHRRLRADRGSIHQPPPVHQTFEGSNFVVCSFVPRLVRLHPDAIKVPYHHANVDSDEVLFYSAATS
jgi:homogentisate 1,2-dioxygenase